MSADIKIASLGWQEPQPPGTAKWPTTLRFGKILGTTSVVRSIENPQDVLQKIHQAKMWFLTIFYKYMIQQYFTVTAPNNAFSQYLKQIKYQMLDLYIHRVMKT